MIRKLLFPAILICFFQLFFARPGLGSDEAFTISIPCRPGAEITAERNGEPPEVIGKVLAIPEATRWPSFTASSWGSEGTVTATAVNAIHILISVEKGRGRTVSILPSETIAPAAGPGAAIVTDIRAGRSVFGAWAPAVGSAVEVINTDGGKTPLDHQPQLGETLRISMVPLENPYFIEIENRPGGRVMAWGLYGSRLIARVIRPMAGSGRFGGTLYQETGRVRANHPGVIDISTSPEGLVGGFQIIPLEHAFSEEMQGSWKMTQWMIVGPEPGSASLKGNRPMFSGGLLPGPAKGEKLWDIWSTYGRKSLALVRIDGGQWVRMPEATGRQDHALKGVTHLRIYFPFTKEPQAGRH